MAFFNSVFSNPHDDGGGDDVKEEIAADPNRNIISSTGGGATWWLGGLIKTVVMKSETVIQTYRRDLEEFRCGLKKETVALRAVAARVVRDLSGSLEAGTAAAQESLESADQAVGGSVAGILAHGREAVFRPLESSVSQKAAEISSKQHRRFEAQVLAVQCDQKTFIEEPEDGEDFGIWRTGFELAEKEEEIERLGCENRILKGVIEKLVPNVVDYETFWSRYFYRIHILKQAEDARVRLIRRVISRKDEEEEDLSWEVDDDEEEKGVKEHKEEEIRGEKEDKVVQKGICGGLGSPMERSQVEQGVESMVENVGSAERNCDVWISILNEKMQEERKVEEDDFEWDEIEDLGEHYEKRVAGSNARLCNVDFHTTLGAAEEDEVLSWDFEDDDDEPTKP